MKDRTAPGGNSSGTDFEVEIRSGGRGRDAQPVSPAGASRATALPSGETDDEGAPALPKASRSLSGEPEPRDAAIGVAPPKHNPASKHAREARTSHSASRLNRKTVMAGVMLMVAVIVGLLFWNNSKEDEVRVETPGQGHPHTATILPVPGQQDLALWLGTHDGLYLKYLAPGAPSGWRKIGAPLSGTDVMAISSAKIPGSPIYVAGHSIGVQRSDDGGLKWRQIMPGMPARDVHALAVDPQDPNRIYIWAEVVGMFTSSDGGITWDTPGNNETLKNPVQVTVLAVSRGNKVGSPVLYAGTNLGLFKSTDGGESWKPAQGAAAEQPIYALLAVDGPNSSRLYLGTATTSLYSPDGGTTWQRLEGSAELGGIGGLALDATAGASGRLLAVNGANQLLASEDNGQTWSLVP